MAASGKNIELNRSETWPFWATEDRARQRLWMPFVFLRALLAGKGTWRRGTPSP